MKLNQMNFRVLVSPDNVGLLSNELLSKFELQFSMLTVLPDYCENELIQTVVQSARDYNPGIIVRSVHLDLTLRVNCKRWKPSTTIHIKLLIYQVLLWKSML